MLLDKKNIITVSIRYASHLTALCSTYLSRELQSTIGRVFVDLSGIMLLRKIDVNIFQLSLGSYILFSDQIPYLLRKTQRPNYFKARKI